MLQGRINKKRILRVGALVYSIHLVLFLAGGFTNEIIIGPIKDEIKFDVVIAGGIALNAATLQNNSIVYMLILYVVLEQLRAINEFVNQLKSNQVKQVSANDIRTIAILIQKVSDTLESIKMCYTINNIIYIVHFSSFSILCIYGLLSHYFQPNSNYGDLAYIALSTVWEIFYLPFLVWTFVMSSWIKNEGNKTNYAVKALMYESSFKDSSKAFRSAELLSLQLSHCSPMVECGVFIIDWRLLFSTICVCFSYLVIIVQFEFKVT